MKPAVLLALLFVSCVAAQQPTAPPTTPVTKQLPAFTNITSCVPLNILITPSDDGAHTLSVAGTPDAHGALTATVVNSTLFLGFNRSFESTQPIRITVSLPADKLSAVEGSMGYVIVNPGFNVSSNVTLIASGSGGILARNLSTPQLIVKATGTADVFARGSFKVANVTAQGTSTVTLSGVTSAVGAQLDGISKLYVDAGSDSVSISASSQGLSKVYYNKGKCEAKDQGMMRMDLPFFDLDLDLDFGFGGSSCVQLSDPEDYPSYRALWSCGLRVRGADTCVPGDLAAEKAAQQAATISVASANAASPGSQAAASASSSGPTNTPPATATASSTPPPPAPAPATTTTTTTSPPAVTTTAPANATPQSNTAATTTTTAPATTATGITTQTASAFRPAPANAALLTNAAPSAESADIKVAAAGRRRLQGARADSETNFFPGRGLSNHVSSSSSSSSSGGGGRRSRAVAVASLDCEAADTDLYIPA